MKDPGTAFNIRPASSASQVAGDPAADLPPSRAQELLNSLAYNDRMSIIY